MFFCNTSFYIGLAVEGFDVKPDETSLRINWHNKDNVRKYFIN